MMSSAFELELPLGDTGAGELAQRRLGHLAQVPGVDSLVILRLTRSFPTLSAIYSASDAELTRAVGDVAAARIRWFLDAPLATGALTVPSSPRPPRHNR